MTSFCYLRTKQEFEYPCPEGTYKNITGGRSLNACKPCEPGYYCSDKGLAEPNDKCDGGYYCTGGSWTKTPSGNETYNNTWVCPIVSIGIALFQ